MPSSVACVGCGGHVPDIDGPTHRYIGASPGCWALYAELTASGRLAAVPAPHGVLSVDAYAAQHPGVPGPQSTQSVWVHLITLQLVLEAGWPAEQAIRLRTAAADASGEWTWLRPPPSLGPVTVVDVAASTGSDGLARTTRRWVEGTWHAWATDHDRIRDRAASIVRA